MSRLVLVVVMFVLLANCLDGRGIGHIPPPPGLPLPSLAADFDLEEGRLNVTLHPERGLVEGHAILWGRLYGPSPHFPFLVHSRAHVPRLLLPCGKRLKGKRAGHRMDVLLPLTPRRPKYVGIRVEWLVKVGAPAAQGEIAPFLTPLGAYLPSDLFWHPRGIKGDRAKWQLILKMPRHWKVEGIGRERQRFMSEGRVCYRFRLDKPVEAMSFAAGPFEQTASRQFYGGRVRSLTLANRTNSPLRDHVRTATRVLEFYKRHLGNPEFQRYTLIDMPGAPKGMPDGVPYRVASEMDFSLIASPPEAAKGPYLEFLGTELARCWFGRRVKCRDNLGEALCLYMGMLAVRKFDTKTNFLMSARAKAQRYLTASAYRNDARLSAIRGLGENVSRGTYEIVVRNKAPILLLCLEQACGGLKAFMRVVKKFVYHHRDGSPVGWGQFLEIYEKDSGVDLSNFALLYIDGPGIPPDVSSRIGYDSLPEPKSEGGE